MRFQPFQDPGAVLFRKLAQELLDVARVLYRQGVAPGAEFRRTVGTNGH
jgi:hypothetical protein